jgi:hypothetical protein
VTANRAETNRKNARMPRIRPQLKAAIEAMVFEGLTRREAAAAVGMTDHGLREALR